MTLHMKRFRFLLSGFLVAAFALSLSVSAYAAVENKDVYFGGTAKETISQFAEIKIRGTLTEIPGTTVPVTLGVTVGTKVYLVDVAATTKIVRKYEGKSILAELVLGDVLEVRGTLLDTGNIKARKIKDESIALVGYRGVPGTVKSIDADAKSFVVTSGGKEYTILTDSDTKVNIPGVKKNGTIADLMIGDKIGGRVLYNSTADTRLAKIIVVLKRGDTNYVKTKMMNIEGRVLSIEGTTVPTTVKVKRGKVVFKAHVMADTLIVRNNFAASNLTEFRVGDKVRVIGQVDADNELMIHVKLLRNHSLKSLSGLTVDVDEDGIPDVRDEKLKDHDNDGILDATDPDDDNDGILDRLEKGNVRLDHDNDGIKDNKDNDDDNDGIKDTDEPTKAFDHDNDGTDDAKDTDDDNDGILDTEDLSKSFDHDNDGKRDDRDDDDDNDGIKDADEVKGQEWDHDNDGKDDLEDTDDDNDGIEDSSDTKLD